MRWNRLIGLLGRVFTNNPGDLGSIPGHIIPKTLKIVHDTSLLNTQQYKVYIKGKVEQFKERSSALLLHLGVVAIEKGAFWSPLTMVAVYKKTYIYICKHNDNFCNVFTWQLLKPLCFSCNSGPWWYWGFSFGRSQKF